MTSQKRVAPPKQLLPPLHLGWLLGLLLFVMASIYIVGREALRSKLVVESADSVRFYFGGAALLLALSSVLLFVATRRAIEVEREASRRFQLATSAVRVAIYDWHIAAERIAWSEGLSETFGYPLEEVGSTVAWWTDKIHPDDLARVSQKLDDAVQQGSDFVCEYRFRHGDGRYLDVWDRGRVVQDERGQAVRMIGGMEDITERNQAQAALRQQSDLYEALLQAQSDLGEGLAILVDGKLVYSNAALCEITGYTHEELMALDSLFNLIPLEGRSDHRQFWRQWAQGEVESNHFEAALRRKDGRRVEIEAAIKEVLLNDGQQLIIICRDITERKRASAALRESESKYSELIRQAPDAIISLNQYGVIETFNPAAERMSGCHAEETVGCRLPDLELVAPASLPKVVQEVGMVLAGRERVPFEMEIVRRDGMRLVMEANPRLMQRNGQTAGVQLTLRDISERKAFEEQLTHQAFHDPLTDLPNRTLFRDRVERALARAKRHQSTIAVLFLDLDRFKVVNDSLGHEVGDQLLVQVARRLQQCLRFDETVARLGGDEFTILLEDVTDASEATVVAERVATALEKAFTVEGRELFITTSIGIVLSSGEHRRSDELLRDADMAMYQAKERGKAHYEVFDSSMNTRALERFELESELRQAIEREAFEIYYQPLVRYDPEHYNTFTIVGMEALTRWFHPKHGMVSPQTFISLAEETGLIHPLGQWILTHVCRQVRDWQGRLPSGTPLEVNVNLSPRQFQRPDLVEEIARVLEQSGLNPHCLKLEITENVVMEDAESTIAKLHRLKELGIQLAIDDFGTGWSSLSYLKRFPIDTLKIDRSFVRGLIEDTGDQAIVLALVTLARTLGLQVTAEGIESAEQMSLLLELGCHIGQGYYFAKALPAAEVFELLQKQHAPL